MAGVPWPAGTSACVVTVMPERWALPELSPEAQTVVEETLARVREAYLATAEYLAAHIADELRAHDLGVQTSILGGRPSEALLQCAADLPADLIVIGAKGLSAPGEFHMGSTAHKLVDYAECSVLVARPCERGQPLSVILAADGSPEALRAAEVVCNLSLPRWAEVAVVSVAEATVGLIAGERSLAADVPDVVRRALLDAAEASATSVRKRLTGCGAQVRRVIRLGHAATQILAVAAERDADLIVVGARGQTRAGPFRLGDVAQKIVKYAPCSVLLVR
jgi:nucleotide-binding universal stress UspA family protein